MRPEQEKSARQMAVEIVGRRALSRKELEQKLTRKGAVESDICEAADWLEELGAINDGDYAAMVVRHCSRKGWGVARAREELRRRGVDKALWDSALEELDDPAEAIDRFLRDKLRGEAPDERTKKRLTDGLLRRGFSWGDVRAAWGRLGAAVPTED